MLLLHACVCLCLSLRATVVLWLLLCVHSMIESGTCDEPEVSVI